MKDVTLTNSHLQFLEKEFLHTLKVHTYSYFSFKYLGLDGTNVKQLGTIELFVLCLFHQKDQVTKILSL